MISDILEKEGKKKRKKKRKKEGRKEGRKKERKEEAFPIEQIYYQWSGILRFDVLSF